MFNVFATSVVHFESSYLFKWRMITNQGPDVYKVLSSLHTWKKPGDPITDRNPIFEAATDKTA